MKYEAIFFSPHLDDAILSCGGLIINLVRDKKKVLIVTVFNESDGTKTNKNITRHVKACGFDDIWKLAKKREKEDKKMAKILKVKVLWLDEIEANYRENYKSYKEIIEKKAIERELDLVGRVNSKINNILKKLLSKNGEVYFPMGLGNHIDHLIVNRSGLEATKKYQVYFWEDYPYLLFLKNKIEENKYSLVKRIDVKENLNFKKKLIENYDSQLKELFKYKEMYLSSFENYYQSIDNSELTKRVFYISDELIGGARIANDYLIKELDKYLEQELKVYEQVPPKINGALKRIRRWLWSVANFYRYMKKHISKNDQIITTSPNLLMALLFFHQRKIKKVIYYSHADRGGKCPQFGSAWIYWWSYRLSEYFSLIKSDLIIVPSKKAKEGMLKRFWNRIDKNKIRVVENGVDEKVFYPSKKIKKERMIMYCGRIDSSKKLEELFEALKGLNKIKLIVLYPKVEMENMAYFEKLKKIGKNKVLWINPKCKEEIREYYCRSECVVIPSDNESFSLVLLEALACKTLVIGKDVGEIGVLLRKIDPFLVLKDGNSKEIADKIGYVMDLSEEKKEKMLSKAGNLAKFYKWKNSGKKLWKELF